MFCEFILGPPIPNPFIGSDPETGVPLIPGITGAPLLLELLDIPLLLEELGAVGSTLLIFAILEGLVYY